MADEPWLWGKNFSIGPWTGGDEKKNAAAKQRLDELRTMQRELSARQQAGSMRPQMGQIRQGPNGPEQYVETTGMAGADGTGAGWIPVAGGGGGGTDPWGYPVDPGIHPADSGVISPGVPIDIARNPWELLRKDFTSVPSVESGVPHPNSPDIPQSVIERTAPYELPTVEEAATTPPPQGGLTEGIAPYLQELERLYGTPNAANPAQDAADANAKRDAERTRLLAQLAFAGGLTKAGGAGWAPIGEGFMDAAGVYDKGFKRYQDALQDSADRYTKRMARAEDIDFAKKDAALKLYSAERSDARDRIKERAKIIDKFFEDELTAAKNELEGTDPKTVADIMRRRQMALNSGEYIPPFVDVSD